MLVESPYFVPFVNRDFVPQKPWEMLRGRDGNIAYERLPFPLATEELRLADIMGECGGVKAAAEDVKEVVEIAAEYGEPVYALGQFVHDIQRTAAYEALGVINVNRKIELVPPNSLLILTAHGSTVEVYRYAAANNIFLGDTTCQLVSAVERTMRRALGAGLNVDYYGKIGHPEAEKMRSVAMSILPFIEQDKFRFIDEHDDPETIKPRRTTTVFLSQTTVSSDEFSGINEVFSATSHYDTETRKSICPAADNRQHATGVLVNSGIDMLLVVGSKNSHNTTMMTEKGIRMGMESHQLDGPGEIDPLWLVRSKVIGLTAGAPVSDPQIEEFKRFFEVQGVSKFTTIDSGKTENTKMFKRPQFQAELRVWLDRKHARHT